ncbi:MAG: VWA domain-containing protein [Gammaproteobacteria bacterium]|nr:VWA domain-containing protein [Gammaproteobacteria bacterium]
MPAQLRITRSSSAGLHAVCDDVDLLDRHAELAALIRRHLPAVGASLLAMPRRVGDSGDIEWYSDLAGQPVRLDDLGADEQARARALLADRVAAVRALADRLPAGELPAAWLRAAVSFPDDSRVYVIGGQPVITFWGHADRRTAAAAPGTVVATPAGVPWQRGLLGLLALAALVLVAWYAWQADVPVIDGPVTATQYCAQEKIVAPPTVIVYDNSGSMAYPLNMPAAELNAINDLYHNNRLAHEQRQQVQAGLNQLAQLFGAGQRGDGARFPALELWVRDNYPDKVTQYGPQRMAVARPLVTQLVGDIAADVALGMVAFSDCDTIAAQYAHAGGDRGPLRDLVAGLMPQGGTPIAASLRTAADMLDGTREQQPGLIILITDGVEQCGADPCAVAREIKQHKPWLAAHVVKLGPETSSACVAETLGGRVYQPDSAEDLAQAVAEARITAPFELACAR